MIRGWLAVAVFAGLVAMLAFGLTRDPSRVSSPLIGLPVPAFQAERLASADEHFDSTALRGEWSLLNVWASWCTTCLEEHELLMRLSQQLALYGINHRDTRDEARNWLQVYGNPYRASAFDEYGEVGIELGVYKVPETFLLDPDGVIRYKHVGALDEEAYQEQILARIREGRP
ncbi:MAG: DsbE family thiol:disulfide interchange protein [Gammaproteobacteria bacterium]|nr:DsbE family thiol:disulfide interchange protein [Gammaproteobacteria bacterium]